MMTLTIRFLSGELLVLSCEEEMLCIDLKRRLRTDHPEWNAMHLKLFIDDHTEEDEMVEMNDFTRIEHDLLLSCLVVPMKESIRIHLTKEQECRILNENTHSLTEEILWRYAAIIDYPTKEFQFNFYYDPQRELFYSSFHVERVYYSLGRSSTILSCAFVLNEGYDTLMELLREHLWEEAEEYCEMLKDPVSLSLEDVECIEWNVVEAWGKKEHHQDVSMNQSLPICTNGQLYQNEDGVWEYLV